MLEAESAKMCGPFPGPNLPPAEDNLPWMPGLMPRAEYCGRCWHNHIPGFVCNCGCHVKIYPGNGSDYGLRTTSGG